MDAFLAITDGGGDYNHLQAVGKLLEVLARRAAFGHCTD